MAKDKNVFNSLVADVEKIAAEKEETKKAKQKTKTSAKKKSAEKSVVENAEKPAEKKDNYKGPRLEVETRKNVRTFFFPPELVTRRKDGFTLYGLNRNGVDYKMLIPRNDGTVEAKQLGENAKMPGHLVVTIPEGATVQAVRAVEDKETPKSEQYEVIINVGVKGLEKLQKEYTRFEMKEQAPKEATEQTAETSKEEKPAMEKPVWVLKESVVPLKNGAGYLVKGFSHGDKKDLAVLVDKKSARMTREYLMITPKKGDQFFMYDPSKSTVEPYKTSEGKQIWVNRNTLNQVAYRVNQEIRQQKGTLKPPSPINDENEKSRQ